MGKVFAYTRVSTPRQGEKGVSLQEQNAAIARYAQQHGLEIVRSFEERDTASKTGRIQFNKMLRLLRMKVAEGVIIHKIDRSARNLEDWADLGRLADAGAGIHFATENLDLKTVAGRLSADIQAVVAAHYSRNLREEAKKGFYGRLKQGYYPLRAPIGYLDQGSAKAKVPDPIQAPLVRRAFEIYCAGTHSLPKLASKMQNLGLRNRNGGTVSVNGMARLLKNSFYIGLMKIDRTGEMFRGKHEPLVNTDMFEKAQLVLAGKRVDRSENHIFLFSRIVRCGTCGYSLIAERQKGHVYYRCHNRPFKNPAVCPRTSIREEQLEESIRAALAEVELSDEELRLAQSLIEEKKRNWDADRAAAEKALQLQSDHIDDRLSRLTDLLVENTIEPALFDVKKKSLLLEQAGLRGRLYELSRGNDSALRELGKTVELAKSPSLLYQEASFGRKRELLKILLSNLSVSAKNVDITLSLPFRLIRDREKNSDCRADRGSCRTWEILFKEIQNHSSLFDRSAA